MRCAASAIEIGLGSVANSVRLRGKLTRVGPLQYSPAGTAICELELAIKQAPVGKQAVGYVAVTTTGDLAESARYLRVGTEVAVEGSLLARSFRDRRGQKVSEVRVMAERIEKSSELESRGEENERDGRQKRPDGG